MATLTLAGVQGVLIARCSTMMSLVKMDATTKDTANADLADPVRCAIREIGYDTIDPLAVTDEDLAPIAGPDVEKLLDRAEQRTLETVWGNWTQVDMQQGDDAQKLSQLADRLLARIKDLEERIRKPYGLTCTGAVMAPLSSAVRRRNDQNPRQSPGLALPMMPYPASFWRHSIAIYPAVAGEDGSMGEDPAYPAGFACRANVQGNPRHGDHGRKREEIHGGTQTSTGYLVYLEPTAGMPDFGAETRIVWGNLRLIALDRAEDRGGYGVALLTHCISIT